jgi:processive 1,2-diacylglycerol beta-glucosyltransferase
VSLTVGETKPIVATLVPVNSTDSVVWSTSASNIRTIGFATNVPELLQLCDFVISKPGGAQTTECLYFKKPILMINSSGGQEVANYKYFSNNGYGKRFRTPWGLNHFVSEINSHPEIIIKMQKNMQKNHNDEAMAKLYSLCKELLQK